MRWQDYLTLAIIIAGCGVYFWWIHRNNQKKIKAGKPRLTRSEKAAMEVLQANGFELQEIHPGFPVSYQVDEKVKELTFKANLMVRKQGRSYLVVLKSGGQPVTAGQYQHELMLKQMLFMPAGIIVLNPDTGKYQQVSISMRGYTAREKLLTRITLVMLIVTGTVMLMWFYYARFWPEI